MRLLPKLSYSIFESRFSIELGIFFILFCDRSMYLRESAIRHSGISFNLFFDKSKVYKDKFFGSITKG